MTALALERLRALVVDDERLARGYLTELLVATGRVDVTAAVESVAAARQVLDGGDGIDAVFVDVRLSERSRDESGLTWVRSDSRRPSAASAPGPRALVPPRQSQLGPTDFGICVVDGNPGSFKNARAWAMVRLYRPRGVVKT